MLGRRKSSERFADNHALDAFYLQFENKFRGSEAAIKENVTFYAELLKRSSVDFHKHPILDIGCGRGELLSILKQYSLPATGVDINKAMVKRAKDLGLEAKRADAITFLRRSRPNSFGAITGMQIIEHIPFESLVGLFAHAYRTLTDGGLVAFETPNPENLLVGTYSFYMDPSHLHPLPPPLVTYALESVGFKDIEVLYRHDAGPRTRKYSDPLLDELQNKMRGPLDYAVIGYKRNTT